MALHAFDETVLYKTGTLTTDGFEATRIQPVTPLPTPFPTSITAQLSVPEDLLTGTLDDWGGAARACTHFVMVRIVKWPKPEKKNGVVFVPAANGLAARKRAGGDSRLRPRARFTP